MGTLQLEDQIIVGGSYTGLLEMKIRGSSDIHLLQSTVRGTTVEFTGEMEDGYSHFLVVQAVVKSSQSTPSRSFLQLTMSEATKIYPMPNQNANTLCKVVEVCAGLGCLGHGMQQAGFQTVVRFDWSKPISDLAHQLDGIPSCVADITDDATLIPICEQGHGAGTLAAGVSCQPYSRLGDQKQQHDTRAETLPRTLRIAHLTRKQIIVLECVDGAMHCKWLQDILHQFVRETGFKIQQGLLHLQQVWPARRTRWWCVLMHSSLGQVQWQSLPSFDPQPTISCLFERFLHLTKEHKTQLDLDTYELGKWGVQGLIRNALNLDKQMATSLHSCANQLIACPCGCRKHPMSENRLQKDGLHGLLVPLNESIKAHDNVYQKMRHIHPDELSLLNGVIPGQKWGGNLRLALCALGQLASPIQSGWIASQIMSHLYSTNLVQHQPNTPLQVLHRTLHDLLRARDVVFGDQTHSQAKAFEAAVAQISHPTLNPPNQSDEGGDEVCNEHVKTLSPSPTEEVSHEVAKPDAIADEVIKQGEHVEERNESKSQLDDLDQAILAVSEPQRGNSDAFAVGAVPGFEVKRKHAGTDGPPSKRQCKAPSTTITSLMTCFSSKIDPPEVRQAAEKGGGPCPRDRWCPNSDLVVTLAEGGLNSPLSEEEPVQHDGYEMIPSSEEDAPPCFEVVKVNVCNDEGAIYPIFAPIGTTVEQLLHAENELHSRVTDSWVTDAMGATIPLHSVLQQDQFVMLSPEDIDHSHNISPPNLCHNKRDIILWSQRGWVAQDEMDFYLHQVGQAYEVQVQTSCEIPADPMWEIGVSQHFLTMAASKTQQHGTTCISAILHKDHWIPVLINNQNDIIRVQTTPAMCDHFRAWWQKEMESSFEFASVPFAQCFPADCGFQTVKWLTSMMTGADLVPMSSWEASELRGSFHRFLEVSDTAEQWVDKPLILGGMNKDEQTLQKLLQDHGVHPKRSQECSEHILKILGQQAVHQILLSPRPWADLKARASMQQPPIRLVLADELQSMIQERVKQGGQVGRKNNKIKQSPHESQARFKLRADQVIVPKAVFVQNDGTELQQVLPSELQPGCKGVVVTNVEDALPFFGLQSPVSSEGVGLLILDFADVRIPECRTIIKVPVLCKQTNEPMLITAALVQIGGKEIMRNTPTTCQAVHEIDNQVFRILVFKDQYPQDWDEFVKAPVRHLMNQNPLSHVSQQIVDVWDRQFLSAKMNKVPPTEAYVFAVSIRVHKSASEELAKSSGVEGKYAEPRIQTGRQPDPEYQVIWLPRKTFGEATLAKQTSPVQCTLVRTADRYGLRTSHTLAEELHKLHRPDQLFLPGTELQKFRVGPMPYGANKQSLANVFKTWQWNARPVGPVGQSRSRDGVLWIVQSAESPQSWVYQLAHGDVLITPEKTTPSATVEQPTPVLASNKTIQSLRQPHAKPDTTKEDPWVHHDPWQSKSAATSKEASVHQIAAVQSRLEAIVDQKIREHIPDTEMGNDNEGKAEGKIVALEQQLQTLSASFQSFQNQQASQNQRVQHQVQALDAKMESQQTNIQQMLDSKLDDQMQRIEHLLSKRQRSQE